MYNRDNLDGNVIIPEENFVGINLVIAGIFDFAQFDFVHYLQGHLMRTFCQPHFYNFDVNLVKIGRRVEI